MEGPELVPEQHEHSDDRTELDHDVKEIRHERLGQHGVILRFPEGIHQDQVAGAADRQPLCDALDDTKKDDFQPVQKSHNITPFCG